VNICVTNHMDGRSCIVRGYHLNSCAWINGQAADECAGCLPRPAETGLLCRSCFEKFGQSLDIAVDMLSHLRSIDRGSQIAGEVRSTTVAQPTYPASWQEADALWKLLASVAIGWSMDTGNEEPEWPGWTGLTIGFTFSATPQMVADATSGLVDWIAPVETARRHMGAQAAVRFYREMQRATFAYPLAERESVIKHIKCRNCQQKTLVYLPPLAYREEIGIRCDNCQHWWDPQFIGIDMRVLAQAINEQQGIDTSSIDRELRKLLSPPPPDEALPVCAECSVRYPDHELAQTENRVLRLEPVDETCFRCGKQTADGIYRKVMAA